ncbi:MAG: TIGR04282 family arsenosugar biosynthesis glycosyltransferase [Candidatus Eisenbacteria bacterium]|nr:TIGR04282 family arsenosugar biosynthesis glycosyltransferase [Candidatus Eisenbacteria bacterium]
MEPDPRPSHGVVSSAISVLAKAPLRGLAKTRLEPLLGTAGCARFQAACLHDVTRKAARVAPGASTLAISPWPAGNQFARLLPDRLLVRPQADGDLGLRIGAALSSALSRHEHVLVLGSDSPDLPPARLTQAIELLSEGSEVVIGPAFDGGYYLIGVTRGALDRLGGRLTALWHDLPWSTDGICAAQVERARSLGLRTVLLDPWWDVDQPVDYERLATRLKGEPLDQDSAVGAFVQKRSHSWLDRFDPDPDRWPTGE